METKTSNDAVAENELIPDSSEWGRKLKALHTAIIQFDSDKAKRLVQVYGQKKPSQINRDEFSSFEQKIKDAFVKAREFLNAQSGLKSGIQIAKDIIKIKRLFESSLYETREQLKVFDGLDKKINGVWQKYLRTNWKNGDFKSLQRELSGSFGFFGGLINECKKTGHDKGAIEAERLHQEICYFSDNKAALGNLEDKIISELIKFESGINSFETLDEFKDLENVGYVPCSNKSMRITKKYNRKIQSIKQKIDFKISELINREVKKFRHEFEKSKAYSDIKELKNCLERLDSVTNDIRDRKNAIFVVERITDQDYDDKFGELQAEISEAQHSMSSELEKAESDQINIGREIEKVRQKTKQLDELELEFTRENIKFSDYIDDIVELNSIGIEKINNNLLEKEINILGTEFDEFVNKRKKANVKIVNELEKRNTNLFESIQETGVDIYKDKSMLQSRKIELENLESLYKRYSVSRPVDSSQLKPIEEHLKELSNKYNKIQANIDVIEQEIKRINMLISTGSADELKKMNLDENRFSFSDPYHNAAINEYKDAILNARLTIENFDENGQKPGKIFDLRRHMVSIEPVNKDYLTLVGIILGTYKCVPVTERPKVFEEKMRFLPFAEHERDFEYLDALKQGLLAWKDRGPLNHIFKNSGQSRYAIYKMIAVIDDYVQKSKEKLINPVVLNTTE